MNNEVLVIERQLNEVIKQLESLEKQRPLNSEIWRLFEEKRTLQRKLSIAKNQETAVLLDYQYPWNTGAPLPHVLSDGDRTFLIYYIGENDPGWNASDKKIIDLGTEDDDITALVEFVNCYNYKFGGINDEVINGHPLYEHGLEAYEAHTIINSNWLKEQEKANSVHSNYSSALWKDRKHYVFTFHDEMFECIANGYNVEVYKGRIRSVFSVATKKLFAK